MPATRAVSLPGAPLQVAADDRWVWALLDGRPERLVRLDAATRRIVGSPVPITRTTAAGLVDVFGYPPLFLACCDITPPLITAAGSVWTVDVGSREIVRVTAAGAQNQVVRIPVEGYPRDVAAGPSGLWAMTVRLPSEQPGIPWSGSALLRIDPTTNTVGDEIVFDRPTASGGTVFQSYGPLQLVVGDAGVFFASRASVAISLYRIDPTSGAATPHRDLRPPARTGARRDLGRRLQAHPRRGQRRFAHAAAPVGEWRDLSAARDRRGSQRQPVGRSRLGPSLPARPCGAHRRANRTRARPSGQRRLGPCGDQRGGPNGMGGQLRRTQPDQGRPLERAASRLERTSTAITSHAVQLRGLRLPGGHVAGRMDTPSRRAAVGIVVPWTMTDSATTTNTMP